MRLPRILVPIILAIAALVAPSVTAHATFQPHVRPIVPVSIRPVCAHGPIRCDAYVVTGNRINVSSAVTPAILRTAYNLPADLSTPQTVGIVLWGSYKTLNSDMAQFDAANNLPACSTSNGCLKEVNEYGQTSPLPGPQGGDVEWALDTQTIHGLCPSCTIVLVEATQADSGDLAQAENTAAGLSNEVNNSWGSSGSEPPASSDDAAFSHYGVAITVSAGDDNHGAEWPADLNSVISVGGTTLQTRTDGSYAGETVWSHDGNGTGSGCSAYQPADFWQTQLPNWNATECGTKRAIADVSADADPASGEIIYAQGQRQQVGGTSLSSPITAATIALAGGLSLSPNPESVPYSHRTDGAFHDVTAGSNGSCGTIMCQAATGYDGPTGEGSPDGVTGFQVGSVSTPSPTAVPTSTTTPVPPTATPTQPVPTPTSTATIPPPPPTPTATPKPKKHDHYCARWSKNHRRCLWWRRKGR